MYSQCNNELNGIYFITHWVIIIALMVYFDAHRFLDLGTGASFQLALCPFNMLSPSLVEHFLNSQNHRIFQDLLYFLVPELLSTHLLKSPGSLYLQSKI